MGSTDVSCMNAKICKDIAGNRRSSVHGDFQGYVLPYRVEIDRLASFSMSQLDGLSDVMCGYCPRLSRAFKLLGKGNYNYRRMQASGWRARERERETTLAIGALDV